MALRLRRGTALERLTIVPAAGELIYTTDTKKLYIGDGVITGGNEVNTEIKGLLADDLYLSTYKLLGSGLELDGATGNISANLITGNLIGSVFADDSTKIIDGITGKVVGPIRVSVNDIEILGGNAGQVLATDGAGNLTWTAGGSGGASALNDLSDVTLGSLTTNEVLKWSGTQWINAPVTPSGHFYGDISGSVFADDSTKIVDGITGNIYTNELTTVTINALTPGFRFNAMDGQSPLIFTAITTGQLSGNTTLWDFRGVKDSIDNPSSIEAGDLIGAIRLTGYVDGYDDRPAAMLFGGFHSSAVMTDDAPASYAALIVGLGGSLRAQAVLDQEGTFSVPQLKVDTLNAAAISAITPTVGMIIYNVDTNRFQGYQNTSGTTLEWVNLS